MEWKEFIMALLTLVFGTGWIFTYRAYKRKANGEAAQSEAEGWKAQQEVYQNTIADIEKSCEYIKADRNLLREENAKLREENNALREKMSVLENKIFEMQKEVSRQGRLIESLREKKTKKTKKPE